MPMPFIPGKQLAGLFYQQAVLPILARAHPGLRHSAALLGPGSEILGFDDPVSMDHHWGPRVMLFIDEADLPLAGSLHQTLARELPREFMGIPTNFTNPNPQDHGTQLLAPISIGPVNHRVTIQTIPAFFADTLAFDLSGSIEPADWLTFPEQSLRSITSAAIFHDGLGLGAACERFQYYPRDVWLYLLASGWARIGQEEHLMGRAGQAGDETGSALIAARLVRDVMRLAFLMERTYAPYPKWFGTAFKLLPGALELGEPLAAVLTAATWQERDRRLAQAYGWLGCRHNALGLTEPMPETAVPFFGRPFQVMAIQGFADALLAEIRDPAVRAIAARPLIGGVDQFSDSTDLLSNPSLRPALKHLYLG